MRKLHYQEFKPRKCWVGETQKIIYNTQEEAEAAALVAEHDHHIQGLMVYHCEYGDHWHITSLKSNRRI